MNRRTFLLAAHGGLAGCMRDTRPRLNVYNWSAYIAPDTIPNFEAEFGVRVRYATYESNEEMLAKVLSGNSGWDVVFPTHNRLEPMRENGLLRPCGTNWLPGLQQSRCALPRAANGTRDLSGACPTCGTRTGIVYNRRSRPRPGAGPTLDLG